MFRLSIFATTILLLLTGCGNGSFDGEPFYLSQDKGNEEVKALLAELGEQTLYFGHQSVGQNIIDGLGLWEEETGVELSMVQSRELASGPQAPFVHFRVGANQDPKGKIDDFVSLVSQIHAEEESTAMFKFCYADFHEGTDVDELFSYYQDQMLQLRDSLPHINFIVPTVPAMAVQKGWRGLAKKILGRAPYGYEQNIKLNAFNQKVVLEFENQLPVFDLALAEVTRPDGTIETFKHKGNEYPCMPSYYTSDFGHLNDFGAKMVSYELLEFLSKELK